jgi:hypothetical protein
MGQFEGRTFHTHKITPIKLFCTKFCTPAKSKKEKELRPSQKVFFGKIFKNFARNVREGKKKKIKKKILKK